jgi:membrane protein DedA with SNARE-associated domain
VPIVPFLIAAGAMQYPRRKFLAALALGRAVRFTTIAYLGSIYGPRIFHWVAVYDRPALYALISLAVIGSLAAVYFWKRHRHSVQTEAKSSRRLRKGAFKKAS